jgi:hypothetical protein
VDHVHVAVGGDGRGNGPAAAHALQDGGGRAGLALDRGVLRGLREPAEQEHRHEDAAQHAQRNQESGQPGEQADDDQHDQHRHAAADDDRERPGVGLVHQAGHHTYLRDTPGGRLVVRVLVLRHAWQDKGF